jgi:hypothetical protein
MNKKTPIIEEIPVFSIAQMGTKSQFSPRAKTARRGLAVFSKRPDIGAENGRNHSHLLPVYIV